MEPTKIYVTGNKLHSGKTLLAAYLADALQCELHSPDISALPDSRVPLIQAAKAGSFHLSHDRAIVEIRVKLVRKGNSRRQWQQLQDTITAAPFIELTIVQPDHRLMDEAEYRIARALADIGLPAYYFSKWDVDTPLMNVKTPMEVFDHAEVVPTLPNADDSLATWVSKDDLGSAAIPSKSFPIQVMVPIHASTAMLMLLMGFPSKLNRSYRVGLNYTARFTTPLAPKFDVVVRLLTIEAEWGVLALIGAGRTNLYGFKREHVYDLLNYCNCVNGDTVVLPDHQNSEDLYKRIEDGLLGYLVALNKTRCVNQIDALTAGDNK